MRHERIELPKNPQHPLRRAEVGLLEVGLGVGAWVGLPIDATVGAPGGLAILLAVDGAVRLHNLQQRKEAKGIVGSVVERLKGKKRP